MAEVKKYTGEDGAALKIGAGLAGAVVIAYTLVPALVALLIYVALLRGRLRRIDYYLLLAGGLALSIVCSKQNMLGSYVRWVGSLIPPFGDVFFSFPVLFSVMALSAMLLGVVGLLDGTAIASKLPGLFRSKSLGEKPSIIPNSKEKNRMKSVAPPIFSDSPPLSSAPLPQAAPGKGFVMLGRGRDGTPTGFTEQEIGTHALVFGATGAGKTETIKSIAGGLLDLGWDGMVLDLKEDTKPGGLRDWCEQYAQAHQMQYQELCLSDPAPRFWFDTLDGLSRDEARDTILTLTDFDDDYYKQICINILSQLLKLLHWANEVDPTGCPLPTIYDISTILAAPSLAAATKRHRAIVAQNIPNLAKSEFPSLESPTQVDQQQAHSWGAKLGNLYHTHAGITILRKPTQDRRPKLDVTSGGLTYIGLDSQGKKSLTRIVSSAVLQRISVESAQRTTGISDAASKKKFLIVDEANWVDRSIVQNLLSRARSAGIAMVLCTQGPKDWIDRSGDDFARLAQNTNVAMIMKQGEPDSAQLCADYIGNVEFMSASLGMDGNALTGTGSLRSTLQNIVTPDELRGLGIGEMIIRVSTPNVRTEWIAVAQRDPKSHAVAQQPKSVRRGPGLARPPLG